VNTKQPVTDTIGQRFGRLVVKGITWDFRAWAECQCDCGKIHQVRVHRLRSGETKSCGCLKAEVLKTCNIKHGAARGNRATSTYKSWLGMKERALNTDHHAYQRYGGRGITICDRWVNSFEAFLEDMGECPVGMSIDRINNDGNYEPTNCRWATAQQQSENRKSNIWIEHQGQRMLIAHWAKRIGMTHSSLRERFKKGWSVERCLTQPPRRQ